MRVVLRALALVAIATAGWGPVAPVAAEVTSSGADRFTLVQSIEVAGSPEQVFDAFTVDLGEWWDHHLSEHPLRLYMEPRPGGGFYEIFDEQGNGARHAEVILARRGRVLRFVGPLGLSGHAVEMVHTIELEAAGEGRTRVRLKLEASGAMEDGWPAVVDRVWHHFLSEALAPYLSRRYGQASAPSTPSPSKP